MVASLARNPARRLLSVLYTAAGSSAILVAVILVVLGAGGAARADFADVAALREGDMRKLGFHDTPRPLPDARMIDASDAPHALADWHGKWVVLNFWATWCAPCRHEMPALDRLQAELGGDDFAVLPVATGRNPLPGITRFYEETGLANLPVLRDPTQAMSRSMGVLGLPVTIIVNPEGQEIARMTGDAEWDSPSAVAILRALIDGGDR
jgi:thiol-disulfide isomerase/thioredoxin